MNLKKLGKKFHNARKVGNKIAHRVAVGMKKGGGIVSNVGQVLTTASALTGQPEGVALGEALMGVGGVATLTGSSVEKLRTGKLGGAVKDMRKAKKQGSMVSLR